MPPPPQQKDMCAPEEMHKRTMTFEAKFVYPIHVGDRAKEMAKTILRQKILENEYKAYNQSQWCSHGREE